MPRVILRTVEPAKELACQSVEKRCTRMKASRATSDIIFSVNGTIACKPIRRRIIDVSPSATMPPKAANAAWRAPASVGAGGQRVDQMAGKHRHEQVGHGRAEQAAGHRGGAARLLQPVAEHEGNHHADGGGTVFSLGALGGHGVIRLRSGRQAGSNVGRDGRQRAGRTRRLNR